MRPLLIVALVVGAGYLLLRKAAPTVVESFEESVAEGVRYVYASTIEAKQNEERWAPTIADAEARYAIPQGLLHRLLYQESRFRSDIIGQYPDGSVVPPEKRLISGANAQGIAQIVPRWHPGVEVWNPSASIYYAASYLSGLARQFNSWTIALAAYNWGPGNVRTHLAQYGSLTLAALPPETRDYVSQITSDVEVA